MPRLSIIIPVPDDLTGLDETLVSVLENRPDDCQIVVVTSGSYDDPYGLAGEVDFVQTGRRVGLIGCINAGICASRAPVVHPLLCGVEVSPDWADIALAHFDTPTVSVVAPLLLDRESPSRVVAAGVTYRRAGVVRRMGCGLLPEDVLRQFPGLRGADISAGFYRKAALQRFGLFDAEAGVSLSTVDMALAMQQAGLDCVIEPESRTYVAQSPAIRTSLFRHGWQLERLFWRWLPSNSRLGSVASHALLVSAEGLQCIVRPKQACQSIGRLFGILAVLLRPDWRETPDLVATSAASVAPPHFATQTERSSAA